MRSWFSPASRPPELVPDAPHTSQYDVNWRIWAGWLIVFAIISAVIPRDVHYDIANYHLHNGWSIWHGRLDRDIAPAGLHTYLNPLHSAFIWALVSSLPGPLVTGLLGLVQAALLPALYVLASRICVRLDATVDRTVIAAVAIAGFLSQPNILMLTTLRNDHWGALAFLVAMAVLIGRPGQPLSLRPLALSAFALGLMFGMKLTNVVYVIGFGVMVLVAVPGVKPRMHAVLASAGAGLAGTLLTGAAWHLALWRRFGNPMFPMMEPVIGPDGNVIGTFRDMRYMPSSFWEGALRPVVEAFRDRPVHDYDLFGPDMMVGYLAAIGCCIVGLRATLRDGADPRARVLLLIAAGFLSVFVAWTYIFSIQRYAMALWMLSPIMALSLAVYLKPDLLTRPVARLGVLAACGAAILTTNVVELRRQPWRSLTEPYVWTRVPEDLDTRDAIIVFSALYPASFTAPAFKDAAWLTYGDAPAWVAPVLVPLQQQVRDAINASDAPVFAVVFVGQDDTPVALTRMATKLGLVARPESCRALETAFDIADTRWDICAMDRYAR